MTRLMIALVVALALPASAQERSQEKPQDKSISARTAGLQKLDGYIPIYWDAATGKMLMEVSRFNTEARAVAKLRHPNIVEVFDVSDTDDEEQYLVVELVRGTTLRKVLQAKRVSGGTLLIKWRMTHRGPQGSKAIYHSFSWSDVYFTDPGESKKYLGLKDSAGSWLGQGDNKTYNSGDQQVVWLKFPAPPANSAKITFVFSGFPPFEDLPVSP